MHRQAPTTSNLSPSLFIYGGSFYAPTQTVSAWAGWLRAGYVTGAL